MLLQTSSYLEYRPDDIKRGCGFSKKSAEFTRRIQNLLQKKTRPLLIEWPRSLKS